MLRELGVRSLIANTCDVAQPVFVSVLVFVCVSLSVFVSVMVRVHVCVGVHVWSGLVSVCLHNTHNTQHTHNTHTKHKHSQAHTHTHNMDRALAPSQHIHTQTHRTTHRIHNTPHAIRNNRHGAQHHAESRAERPRRAQCHAEAPRTFRSCRTPLHRSREVCGLSIAGIGAANELEGLGRHFADLRGNWSEASLLVPQLS